MGGYAWLVAMYREKLRLDPKGKYATTVLLGRLKPLRILITFILVNFAWILFRLPSVSAARVVLRKIFTWEGSGLFLPSNSVLCFILLALCVVIGKESCEEYFPRVQLFNSKHTAIRWISYMVVLVMILLCGVFDSSQFIYVKF